jgi:hypothetical protein
MLDFFFLLLAITIWMVSLFLVSEAAKSQEWAFASGEGIPNPYSGVLMSKLVSLCFLLLWLLRTVLLTPLPTEPLQLLTHVLDRPGPFTPGFLIASFPPLIVGLVKLTTALTASRWRESEDVENRSRLWVNLVLLALHLLTAFASMAILTRFFLR